jgi:hypothetical protein
MNATEQTRFKPLYTAMLRALQLQGKAEKTVEAYARAIRRSADFFDCLSYGQFWCKILGPDLVQAASRCSSGGSSVTGSPS